jgi:predicted LPLAT superfamily acyltransferase
VEIWSGTLIDFVFQDGSLSLEVKTMKRIKKIVTLILLILGLSACVIVCSPAYVYYLILSSARRRKSGFP